jgi:transcription elongation factor Elf1
MQLQDLECPNCGAPAADLPLPSVQEAPRDALFECRYCGTHVDLNRALCPQCAFLNREGERFCGRCGAQVVRVCPFCKHENWAGNEYCASCGRTLDLLEVMTQAGSRDTRARLEAQQRQARLLKMQEEKGSEARMARFWDMERQRLEAVARVTAEKRHRERLVLAGVLFVIALIVLVAVVLLVANGIGG